MYEKQQKQRNKQKIIHIRVKLSILIFNRIY